MSTLGVVLVALVIAIGLLGIVLPVLPGGGFLVFAAIAVWAVWEVKAGTNATVAWVTLGVAAVFFVTSVALTWYATTHKSPDGVMGRAGSVLDKAKPASKAPETPAAPQAPAGAPAGSKAGEVPK